MTLQEIKQLINYHQDGLDQYRHQMSPSAVRLEEQTIKALKELLKMMMPTQLKRRAET
jgi:hypothetical protein